MALISKVTWLWPPNFDGNFPSAGLGFRKVNLLLSGICDTDGVNIDETDVVKLDLSELLKIDRTAPTRTSVESLHWNIGGFNNVKLSWDRAPENTIAVMSGLGKIKSSIVDPGEVGDRTGDILLSTYGAAVGATYSIELCVKLK